MNLKRKDSASICMNNEAVYVFWGSVVEENTHETIEKYDVKTDSWEILPIRLQSFMNMQVTLKVSSKTILIVGK